MNMQHLIGRQILELAVDKGLDAFALQQRVIDRFYQDILPELEKHFNEISGPEQTICISKLELDLGYLSEEMIDSGAWVEQFREELLKKLPANLWELADQTDATFEPSQDTVFRTWLYFNIHGHLPWNAPKPPAGWLDQVLEALAGNFQRAQQLRDVLRKNPVAVKRIVLQHSQNFLTNLATLLTAENQQTLPAQIRNLAANLVPLKAGTSVASGSGERETARKLWGAVLQKSAGTENGLSTQALMAYLVQEWLGLSQSAISLLTSPKKTKQKDKTLSDLREKVAEKLTEATGSEDQKSDQETALDFEEGIFISNAGLVLLHPFLATLFRKLDLVRNNAFPDEERQQRAMCLLHALAEPGTPPQEFDLVLPKLLCGWPLEKPVDTSLEITAAELAEGNGLLEAVIGNWDVLKNSSPAALQQTFLQREGKLFCRDGKWYLQVEKKPFDILLTRLPWTIGMLKLPWMDDLLRVEWG